MGTRAPVEWHSIVINGSPHHDGADRRALYGEERVDGGELGAAAIEHLAARAGTAERDPSVAIDGNRWRSARSSRWQSAGNAVEAADGNRRALAQDSWQRTHGRGLMAEDSWQRTHGRGLVAD